MLCCFDIDCYGLFFFGVLIMFVAFVFWFDLFVICVLVVMISGCLIILSTRWTFACFLLSL